ncbi:MAG: hypothetical protein NVS9B15_20270 [Acidobacteriaceae bacterium]
MNEQDAEDRARIYDRAFLLSEEKRNQVMQLWEIQQYGIDSYADADYVSVYGMKPAEQDRRGIRLLARTAVECTRDLLSEAIGDDVAKVMQSVSPALGRVIIDPFAGSCNTLYWLMRSVPGAQAIACELDETIFEITRQNLLLLDQEIRLIRGDYQSLLGTLVFPSDHVLIVFVAPPWGDALDPMSGLDLHRTTPPVTGIIDDIDRAYHDNPILYVTQIHQSVNPSSLADLRKRFDWSEVRIYDINREGMKHGILLGTSRWKPSL